LLTATPVFGGPTDRSVQSEAGVLFLKGLRSLYSDIGIEKDLDFDAFRTAMVAFLNLRRAGLAVKDSILTIVDYRKDSTKERLFVIDLGARQLLFRTLVAHGKNSGERKPLRFSNVKDSKKSSLGLFITDRTYYGKHGYSLKLRGLEPGYNSNALARAIVVHGADYVSRDFIREHGMLGLSWGCPAVPSGLSKKIIDAIKGGSCLFILGEAPEYLEKSTFQDFRTAALEFVGDSSSDQLDGQLRNADQ
jgi:hypothetical protein